jgi:purine-binding chemotaxis protein CheW
VSEKSSRGSGSSKQRGAGRAAGGGGEPTGPAGPEGEVLPAPDDRVLLFADSLQERRQAQVEAQHQWETWVTCRVDREVFALPVKQVQEILRVAALTRVPHAPFPVRGVTNLRGYVLPVVDLRVRLGMAAEEPGPQHRVMVVHSRGRLIGLLVDAVEQVTQIDRLAVEPVPDDVMTEQSYYLLGVYHLDEREMAILLDADKVLQVRDAPTGGKPVRNQAGASPGVTQ